MGKKAFSRGEGAKHASGGGKRSLSNQIRGLQRLIAHTQEPEAIALHEQRLQDLIKKKEQAAKSKLTKRKALHLRKVRHTERVKLTRALRSLQRQIAQCEAAQAHCNAGDLQCTDEDQRNAIDGQIAALKASVANTERDLQYVRQFPAGERYVPLLVTPTDESARARITSERARLRALVAGAAGAPATSEPALGTSARKRERRGAAVGESSPVAPQNVGTKRSRPVPAAGTSSVPDNGADHSARTGVSARARASTAAFNHTDVTPAHSSSDKSAEQESGGLSDASARDDELFGGAAPDAGAASAPLAEDDAFFADATCGAPGHAPTLAAAPSIERGAHARSKNGLPQQQRRKGNSQRKQVGKRVADKTKPRGAKGDRGQQRAASATPRAVGLHARKAEAANGGGERTEPLRTRAEGGRKRRKRT